MIEEPTPMNKPRQLAETELRAIACEETWHNGDDVKNQQPFDIFYPVLTELSFFLVGFQLEEV